MTGIVLLGPPGAGKGTVSKVFAEKGFVHVSTGELLRDQIRQKTPAGIEAKLRLDQGKFVSDKIVVEMVRDLLKNTDSTQKFLFDGFPRTLIQAKELDAILQSFGGKLAAIIQLDCPDEVIIERLSGRRVCNKCGSVYHLSHNPPSSEGKCDFDGSILQLRPDDTSETIKKRLAIYAEQTAPLIDYYRSSGLIRRIDASLTIEEVRCAVLERLA